MAAGNLGSLVVSLGLDAVAFVSGLTKAQYEAQKSMRSIKQEVEQTREVFQKVTGTIALLSGGVLTFAGIINALHDLRDATIRSEDSINQLNAALKATGNSAGFTVGDLDRMGRALKESTTFSTEDIRKAETALLRFRDVRGEIFEQALGRLPDLAVVLGTTLPEAAIKLGRALEDPQRGLRALRQAGVYLSETDIALATHFAELGDRTVYQNIIFKALEGTRGAAAAATLGLSGATKTLTRSFEELEIAAGKKLFGENHTILATLQGLFEGLTKKIEDATFSLTGFLTKVASVTNPLTIGSGIGSLIGGLFPDNNPAARTSKGKIDFQAVDQSDAKQKQADAEAKDRLDKLTLQQFNQLKTFAEKSAQFYASDQALQKHYLNIKQSDLEFAYAQGEVSSEQFFQTQAQLARDSFAAFDQIQSKRVQAELAVIKSQFSTEADRAAAQGRLVGIVAQSDQARLQLNEKLHQQAIAEVQTFNKLNDEYRELSATAAEAAGNLGQAAQIRFDLATGAKRRTITAEADAGSPGAIQAVADLDAERARVKIRADLTAATQQYALVLGKVGIEQGKIDLLFQTGAITEIDAINKRADLARQYVVILTAQADEQERIARTFAEGTPERSAALLGVQKMRLEIEQLAAASDVLAKKFNDIFAGAIADGIVELVSGTKKLKDVLQDIGKSITTQITQIAAKQVSESLFAKGGPFGGVGDFFAGIFGGKTGSEATGAAALTTAGSTLTIAGTGLNTAAIGLNAAALALSASSATSAVSSAFGKGNQDLGDLLGLFGDVPFLGAGKTGDTAGATALTAAGSSLTLAGTSLTLSGTGLNTAAIALSSAAAALAASSAASALGGSAGSLFGGGGGGFGTGSAFGNMDFGAFLAGGGIPPLGKVSIVGENGPEYFIPRTAGTIIPSSVIEQKRAEKQTVNLHYYAAPGVSKQTAHQHAVDMARTIDTARKLNR